MYMYISMMSIHFYGEINFSKPKLINNYLRNLIFQEKLNIMPIPSVEHEMVVKVDTHEIIQEF